MARPGRPQLASAHDVVEVALRLTTEGGLDSWTVGDIAGELRLIDYNLRHFELELRLLMRGLADAEHTDPLDFRPDDLPGPQVTRWCAPVPDVAGRSGASEQRDRTT